MIIKAYKVIILAGILGLLTLGASPVWAQDDPPGIGPGHTALWYDPARAGEGWVLEVLDQDHATLFWFTYDEAGQQRWLIGEGQILRDDGDERIEFDELLVTHGGRFGPEFDPEAVVYQPVGQAVLRFADCQAGELEFQAFGQSGSLDLIRLSHTMATGCESLSPKPARGYAGQSGSWFDPDHNGEGFVMHWLSREVAVLLWFSYDSQGEQYWMIGEGSRQDGAIVFPQLSATVGGGFAGDFDPAAIEHLDWGSLLLELDCETGFAYYDSALEQFGEGAFSLMRLTHPDGLDCPTSMPALGDFAKGRWDDRFITRGLQNTGQPKVLDFAVDDEGNLLAAGEFRWFSGQPVNRLMHQRNGQWEFFDHEAVAALDIWRFSALASDPEHGLALALNDWPDLDGHWEDDPGRLLIAEGNELREIGHFTGSVRRMVWFQDRLWVGGWFHLGEDGPTNLAVWDGEVWHAAPGGEVDGPVYAFRVEDDTLYVGGAFGQVGGIEAGSLARWDGHTWTGYPSIDGFGPDRVHSIVRTDEGLFVGGVMAGGLLHWTGSEWEVPGEGVLRRLREDTHGVVMELQEFQGDLYAYGCFTHAGGGLGSPDAVRAESLARWDGQAWTAVDDGSEPVGDGFFRFAVCGGEPAPWVPWLVDAQRMIVHDGLLYIGGGTPGFAGVPSQSLVAFDGEQFIPQGEAGLGLNGRADTLTRGGSDGSLYAYSATHFGDRASPGRMARFRGDHWEPVGGPMPAGERLDDLRCAGNERGAVVDSVGTVYIGCQDWTEFNRAEGPPDFSLITGHVFRLEGEDWVELDPVFALPPVMAIALDPQDRLWVAGRTPTSAGNEGGFVARLDGEHFQMLEDGFDGFVSKFAIAPSQAEQSETRLVVGGNFTRVNDLEVNHIAHWNGKAWSALGQGFKLGPTSLSYGERGIYASVADIDPKRALVLGIWNGESWEELATTERGFPETDAEEAALFNVIKEVGDRLILAGSVWPEGAIENRDIHPRNAFVYEDGRFHVVPGNLRSSSINAVAVEDQAIWFGGLITTFGEPGEKQPTPGIARFYWED